MRDWKNTPTREIINKIYIHGYLMSHHGMPLEKMDESEYVTSLLAEIQRRIDNSFNNGYTVGYGTGYDKGYIDGYDYGFR